MRASATHYEWKSREVWSCPTLSDEGVCNISTQTEEILGSRCPTLSYEGVCNSQWRWQDVRLIVVLPSQMRVSATFARKRGVYFSRLSYPLRWGRLQPGENMFPTPNISCPTLSYEGVCNYFRRRKTKSTYVVLPSQMRASATSAAYSNGVISELSYPLRWGRLQPTQNQHIGESDLLLGLFQLLEIQSAYDIELEASQIYGKIYKYYDRFSRFSALQ